MNCFANRKSLASPSRPNLPQNVRTLAGRRHAQCTSGRKGQIRIQDRLLGVELEVQWLMSPSQQSYWVPPCTLIWLWKSKPQKGLYLSRLYLPCGGTAATPTPLDAVWV
jgi:hypothetical protein